MRQQLEMSERPTKKVVGVTGDPGGGQYELLLQSLGQLYPVEFRQVDAGGDDAVAALLVLGGNSPAGFAAAARGLPSFVELGGGAAPNPVGGGQVQFGDSSCLETCLRNQVMIDPEAARFFTIESRPGDAILASENGRAIWLARPVGRGVCHLFAGLLPQLRPKEFLFEYLNWHRFMGLLPLMHFLRQLVKDADWEGPPSRACFIIDDPSFYWRSYGHLNFHALAAHAVRHQYYVSLAMIPLDTWWVNGRVAATLRSSSPRLSVLIHGNNHTTHELLAPHNQVNRLAVAAQALRRMDRLTRKYSLSVHKIMEAPHGALAEDVFQHLLVLGFEAALCTTELLVQHNPYAAWPVTLGMNRSEFLGGGMPVIPRIRISPHWKNDILLAAFLQQPIVIVGHHGDAANSMALLAEIAGTVNRLDGVTWSDLPGMLRSNYRQRIEGDVLKVQMYSRRVRVAVPPAIRHLSVQRSWIKEGRIEDLSIGVNGNLHTLRKEGPLVERIPLEGAQFVELASELDTPLHFSSVNQPFPSPWPAARKVLMEVRDRLSPMVPAVNRLRRRSSVKGS